MNPNPHSLIIHTDGGARGNPGPAAVGFTIDRANKRIHEAGAYIGKTTNNVAEYTAVIHALTWIKNNHPQLTPIASCFFLLDSLLVVNQLAGKFKIREHQLIILSRSVHQLTASLSVPVSFQYIPRAQNTAADWQVNLALDHHLQ